MHLALAAFGSVLAAIVFAWPLPLHMGTRVTGMVSGDTGIYIWNLWLFRHEIVVHHQSPFFTSEILSLTRATDLSLHNYTAFANIIAFPLIPLVGVVSSFNIIYLASTAATAFTTYLLVRHVVGRSAEAWLAGILFAFSPSLVARSTAHFSLVEAAALPLFVLCWERTLGTGRLRYAVAAGLSMAWAMMSDPYYGVYCVLIAVLMLGVRGVRMDLRPAAEWRRFKGWVDVPIAATLIVVMGIAVTGGTQVAFGGIRLGLSTLYTPVLVLTILLLLRVLLASRPHLALQPGFAWRALLPAASVAAATAVISLAPMLWALAVRLLGGGRLQRPVLWRSSPPGVDLLAFVTPNPNHPLLGGSARLLFAQQHDAVENVAAVTFVALAVIVAAMLIARWRPTRAWLVITLGFGALSLGPFIHVWGVNTYVPGPWALLRFVPLLGTTRTPSRFAIVAMMGVAVLFASALAAWRDRSRHPGLVLGLVGAALVFELWPAPRILYSAEIPAIYRILAEDHRPVRILHLPFGIRDGTMEIGGFNTAYLYYQTLHEKPLIGGYLSRIPRTEFVRHMRVSFLSTVTRLSEGLPVPPEELAAAASAAPRFARRTRLGYVVVDRRRASQTLVDLVLGSLDLEKAGESWPYALYRIRVPALDQRATDDLFR